MIEFTAIQTSFFIAVLIVLGIVDFVIFIRVVRGPRIVDRIMSVNMLGTVTIMMLALVAVIQQESYLIDICIIYAVISFISVVVLCKVYMGVYAIKHKKNRG